MKLPMEQFRNIVRDTVLISLDVLIVNEKRDLLIGRRRNSSAKGCLFVPGGRVSKGDAAGAALARISREELRIELRGEDATFHGIYQNHFNENVFGDPEIGTTEYIAIACLFRLSSQEEFRPDNQHDRLRFVPIREVRSHPETHEFTKNYFLDCPSNLFLGAGRQSQME